MFFTLISILLSGIEYIFQSNSSNNSCVMVAKFDVTSKYLARLSSRDFQLKILFRPGTGAFVLGKILKMNKRLIETLPPVQFNDGIKFTFIIEIENNDKYSVIDKLLQNVINDGSLALVCSILFQLYINISTLFD